MQLPPPGDPIVTRNGKVVEPRGVIEPDYSLEVPIAKNIRPKNVRSVREMGTDAQTQTIVNAVLLYQLVGISTNETAFILGTTGDEIEQIKSLPAYQETFEMLFYELLSTSSSSIQARIASYAGKALDNLMNLANEAPRIEKITDDEGNIIEKKVWDTPAMVVMKSNDSILDRAGLNAEQLFGHGKEEAGQQLEIEVTSATDNKTNVRINLGKGR